MQSSHALTGAPAGAGVLHGTALAGEAVTTNNGVNPMAAAAAPITIVLITPLPSHGAHDPVPSGL
jgi:hypothetical protein